MGWIDPETEVVLKVRQVNTLIEEAKAEGRHQAWAFGLMLHEHHAPPGVSWSNCPLDECKVRLAFFEEWNR